MSFVQLETQLFHRRVPSSSIRPFLKMSKFPRLPGPQLPGGSLDFTLLLNITNWKITLLLMGKLTISTGAIFNSFLYVCLPEGNRFNKTSWRLSSQPSHHPRSQGPYEIRTECHLVICYSSPWKDPPFLIGKPR